MARLSDAFFDRDHPAGPARFWAAPLDDYDVAPYDEAEVARPRQLSFDDPEDDLTVLVVCRRAGPRLSFQSGPEPKTVKNRVRVELGRDDVAGELGRLQALGAIVLLDEPNDTLIVLTDPEGNAFCLCAEGAFSCASLGSSGRPVVPAATGAAGAAGAAGMFS